MKFLTPLCLLFSLSSCYHVYYSPSTANITQFTEKDDVRICAGLISGGESEFVGVDMQMAYAPAKNFGVMLNGFTAAKQQNTANDRRESGEGIYGEAAVGYFNTFDKRKMWTFEVYGGAGKGSAKNDYGLGESSNVSVNKLFLQPAIGFKWDYVELAVAPKLAWVNWNVKSAKSSNNKVLDDMDYIRHYPDFFSFEPTVILRGGGKHVKAQVGVTFGSRSVNEYFYESPTETVVGYLGLSFNVSAKKKPVVKDIKDN